MIAMRTVAVNYSLVGEKPYDQVYGGLWQACLVKDGSKTCDDLMVGQGRSLFLLKLHVQSTVIEW